MDSSDSVSGFEQRLKKKRSTCSCDEQLVENLRELLSNHFNISLYYMKKICGSHTATENDSTKNNI